MPKHPLLLFMLGAGISACDGLPGNEPQQNLIGYWQCEQGAAFFAFAENQMAARILLSVTSDYSMEVASYRVLQRKETNTLVDTVLEGLARPWQVQFTSDDTFITNLFAQDIICDRTDKASFDALQPPVVFPLPETANSNRTYPL